LIEFRTTYVIILSGASRRSKYYAPGTELQTLARSGVEDVHIPGIESQADRRALRQSNLALHPRAHERVRGLEVDDGELAQLLDQLDARRDAGRGDGDATGACPEHGIALAVILREFERMTTHDGGSAAQARL